jgi:large subunit ribosomal protein L6
MSRVGKYPVTLPAGVSVAVANGVLTAKGRLGELKLSLSDEITAAVEGNKVVLTPRSQERRARTLWGTTRSLVAGMVKGVSEGYAKSLEINGTGFRAAVQGKELVLNLGFSHEIRYPVPPGIKITCEKPTSIKVEGIDKQRVGQVAAEIRAFRPPEPWRRSSTRRNGARPGCASSCDRRAAGGRGFPCSGPRNTSTPR